MKGNRGNFRKTTDLTDIEVCQWIDSFQEFFRKDGRSSSRPRSGSRTSTNQDRIRYLRCRVYDHFAKDCANMTEAEEDQSDQMHQLMDTQQGKIH